GFELSPGDDSEPLACFAPEANAHAVADVKFDDLLAVILNVNTAVGHDAVDVAQNQLDLGTGFSESHLVGSLFRRVGCRRVNEAKEEGFSSFNLLSKISPHYFGQ